MGGTAGDVFALSRRPGEPPGQDRTDGPYRAFSHLNAPNSEQVRGRLQKNLSQQFKSLQGALPRYGQGASFWPVAGVTVSVCENPALLAAAAGRLGSG